MATMGELEAADSPLGRAVATAANEYFGDDHYGELGFALDHIRRTPGPVPLRDYWENSALDALVGQAETEDFFNDSTSSGDVRTTAQYLTEACTASVIPPSPYNTDSRFVGYRPKGFEIKPDQQPVMALVALDPSKMPKISREAEDLFIEQLEVLLPHVIRRERSIQTEIIRSMNPSFRKLVRMSLLHKETFVEVPGEQGPERWERAYDLIAGVKALYTLISGEQSSGGLRQGAVRVRNADAEIIVAGSGQNSAIDEAVARDFARSALAALSDA